ncbi:hypothetical protein SNE40_000468 [Patella caerulea]
MASRWGDLGEIRIALLGKTGVGKSHLGNNLLQQNAFGVYAGFGKSGSLCSLYAERKLDDHTNLFVVDTPGLFDTRQPNEKTKKEIVRSIALAAPGPFVYIFVIAIGRFTKEEVDTIDILQEILGDDVINHVIIVFTRKEDLGDMLINDFVLKSPPGLRNLIQKCHQRFAFINNKGNQASLKAETSYIFDLIHKTIEDNKHVYFTNRMYQDAEQILNERSQEIQKEVDRSIRELRQKRISLENRGNVDTLKAQLLAIDSEIAAKNHMQPKKRAKEELLQQDSSLLGNVLDRMKSAWRSFTTVFH